jgi:hypothetical protein
MQPASRRPPPVAERFARFAREAEGSSPVYARLSAELAPEPRVAEMLTRAPLHQQRPNLLYAAVHDLLLRGLDHPLAAWYPSVGGTRAPDTGLAPAFLDVLERHADEVRTRVEHRRTQTNEVGRAAALLPAVAHATSALPATPTADLALVELGTSAGLLLHLDRYTHDLLGVTGEVGAPRLAPRWVGPVPPVPTRLRVAARTGLDLEPLDPGDPDDAAWLRACVWPEHVERLTTLDRALGLAASCDDVRRVRGDVVDLLEDELRRVPAGLTPVVLHSAALAYLDEVGRDRIGAVLDAVGARRDMIRVSLEGPMSGPFVAADPVGVRDDEPYFLLGCTTWVRGRRHDELLARVQPRGHWVRWLAPAAV